MSTTQIGIILFWVSNAVAIGYAIAALRNLNPHHPNAATQFFARGAFAGRNIFTSKGWAYRNRALFFHWLGLVLAIMCFLL